MGSGNLPVLATPRLAALMENAAFEAVAPIFEVGDTTVGGEICLRHLAPSPVGAEVTATAVLERIEGRKFTFRLEARQGETLIGEGTHTRFVVNATSQSEYQVHARFVLLDTETGYRSQYLQQSFLIQL